MLARTVTPLPTKIGALAIGIGLEWCPGVVNGPSIAGLGSTDVGGDCANPRTGKNKQKAIPYAITRRFVTFLFQPSVLFCLRSS